MDVSLKYADMCRKAVEIQKLFHLDPSNVFWDYTARFGMDEKYVFSGYGELFHELNFEYDGYVRSCIWLPRQDQLQEMIIERTKCSSCKDVALAYMFHSWMTEEDGHSFGFGKAVFSNPSMEQLWLAFVMKENFQKIWNGEEWK